MVALLASSQEARITEGKLAETPTFRSGRARQATLATLVFLVMGGCAQTRIIYPEYPSPDAKGDPSTKIIDVTDVPVDGLVFALQKGTILLDSSKSGGAGSQGGAPTQPCPKGTTKENWWQCFKGVGTKSVAAPYDGPLYEAKGDNFFPWNQTNISGDPLPGSQIAYSKITISTQSNLPAVITAVGTGAATGFAIGGPWGAAAGAVIGVAGAGVLTRQSREPISPQDHRAFEVFKKYVCPDAQRRVELSESAWFGLTPALSLPVVVDATGPFETDGSSTSSDNCWHLLPNNLTLTAVVKTNWSTGAGSGTKARQATQGDGWLYRIIGSNEMPPMAQDAGGYFLKAQHEPQKGFPYSACQMVTLQVTWWYEVLTAIEKSNSRDKTGTVNVVQFEKLKIPDPRFVNVANLPNGGVITFEPDCGAYVSVTGPLSSSNTIDTLFQQAQSVLKAQQQWEQEHQLK